MSARPIEDLLPRLKNVKQIHDHEWKASSPTREDKNPSLSIKEEADGTLLLKDFGGDTTEEIVAALGMEMRGLFPTKQGGEDIPLPRRVSNTRTLRATRTIPAAPSPTSRR